MFKERIPLLLKVLKPGKQSISGRHPCRSSQNTHSNDSFSDSVLTNYTVFHVNIRSSIKHFDELKYHVMKNFKYTVTCLTETLLEDELNSKSITTPFLTVVTLGNMRALIYICS